MGLSKKAARIISNVEKLKMNHSPQSDLENVGLYLNVMAWHDEDLAIRYYLANEKTHLGIKGLEGNFSVGNHNPLFFKRQVRKAEGIASEVWIYYNSSGMPCHVSHYSSSLLV